jgi:ABC-2 type transport system permease protein
MRSVFVVAQREFAAMVATRAFLATLIMMPILMLGGLFLIPTLTKLGGGKTQRILVFDATGQLVEPLQQAAELRNRAVGASPETGPLQTLGDSGAATSSNADGLPEAGNFWNLEAGQLSGLDAAQRQQLNEQVRQGELYAWVELPAELLSDNLRQPLPEVHLVCQDGVLSDVRGWLSATLQQVVRLHRLNLLGLDPHVVAMADAPLQVTSRRPGTIARDEGAEARVGMQQEVAQLLVPVSVMLLMFLVIFLAAQPMLESAMEEKNQRIAELLLGLVKPWQLMAGKLLGNVGGSLLVVAIYGLGGGLVLHWGGWAESLSWQLVPWFLVFQVLAVLMFSSIFLTIGASVSDLKEAQSLLLPVWLVLMLPVMVWIVVLRDPNGPVALGLSFFPPSAPMVMVLRIASGQILPAWQPVASVLVMLAATVLMVWGASRIYRASLLRSGSARSVWSLLARLGG